MDYNQLKLENQLCFPFYAASRLIIRHYQPHLDRLGITYPQYLVLMVLWEKDGVSVNEIANQLILNTNTITPLLKRMEKREIVQRKRSTEDERKVLIHLSSKGKQLQEQAAEIPAKMAENLNVEPEELACMKDQIMDMIAILQKKPLGV
jgi:DNA-binding MarR family transcriptional regulator